HPDAAEFFADTWTRILLNCRFEEATPLKINFPAFRGWLKTAYADDLPYREFARMLLSDHGDNVKKPASNFLLAAVDPNEPPWELTDRTTRVFLGLQIQCARCHDHPFEKWTQEDFWGLTAFFNGVKGKARTTFDGFGVKLVAEPKGMMMIPDTKTEARPRFLDGRAPAEGEAPLAALARFVLEHPQFHRAIVNRVWGHFMGRGFVDPVDRFTAKSQAEHLALFDRLTDDFVKGGTRLKPLMRTILLSTPYQAGCAMPGDRDVDGHAVMRLKPQNPIQVLNMLVYTLQMDTFLEQFYQGYLKNFGDDNFFAKSYGNRDVFRMFLHLFAQGLLAPSGVAPEESKYTGSVRLALKLMNGGDLQNLVKAEWGLLAKILKKESTPEGRLVEIFLTLLSRPPDAAEQERYLAYIKRKGNTAAAYEDIYWVLLNSTEMIFNH
ncbi:MAG TPA: DUF1549 domain-containing protein, partial [Planctomycetota bacterium]|nr:DUF1549 domain-containing protein [Planctomycetota bacterium]